MKENNISTIDDIDKRIILMTEPTPTTFITLDNYQVNAEVLYNDSPYFYDKSRIWWIWNTDHWQVTDELDMCNILDDKLGFCGQTINSHVKQNYIEAMRRVGRTHEPKVAPSKWIQFKDKAFSLNSGKIYKVKSNFFFCNPIPWEMGSSPDTPIIDKLFEEWVGKKNQHALYELVAYCCYTDYPIQVLFCLYGIGRNGKSCFLRLLTRFLGQHNLCHTELDLLAGANKSRFEASKLYKKLVCQMGETNFGMIEQSSILKQMTGGDLMSFEMKGKDPFTGYSYAKLIIASNSLPISTDTSDGWYRRWIIIDFPNQFPEGKDVLETVPDQEYKNLALKVSQILPELLKNGMFNNQGDIKERKKRYIMSSNPLPVFLHRYCTKSPGGYTRYSTLYTAYVRYLTFINRRVVSITEFGKHLVAEGFEISKTTRQFDGVYTSDRWVEMVELDFQKVEKMSDVEAQSLVGYDNLDDYDILPTQSHNRGSDIETCQNHHPNHIGTIKPFLVPLVPEEPVLDSVPVYLKCHICGVSPCVGFDPRPAGKGRPICKNCGLP